MLDNLGANEASSAGSGNDSSNDYLIRARKACESGDLVLGMHLYLTAYEKAVADPDIPDGMALSGLHEAWHLACDLKERSIAEYVFEKLEPFLTSTEIPEYANRLQDLALDRLEEYGFSREDLADMAKMISQDIVGDQGSVVKVESISIPASSVASAVNVAEVTLEAPSSYDEVDDGDDGSSLFAESFGADEAQGADEPDFSEPREDSDASRFVPTTAAKKRGKPEEIGVAVADVEDFNPYDALESSSVGKSYHGATNDGSGAYIFTRDEDRAEQSRKAREQADNGVETPERQETDGDGERMPGDDSSKDDGSKVAASAAEGREVPATEASHGQKAVDKRAEEPDAPAPKRPAPAEPPKVGAHVFNYRNLVGYDEVVSLMREFGVGLQRDRGFRNFVNMMNTRHGLSRMPSMDTVLLRSPVLEDATRFLDATIGEIGLPVLRMSMEENVQGMPLLCVSVQGDSRPRMNHANNRFEGPGILVVEDLDMWALPPAPEGVEGIGNFVMANISRGAREAVNFIRSAVEDPDVYVLATATTSGDVDPFFYDLLEPLTVIDIGYPTDAERDAIWAQIMDDHPSMRGLDRAELTRFSAGLARYDIYLAARSAVEEAYKNGLVQRMFVPVTEQNMFDKLAACQMPETPEYKAIEDEIIRSFKDELDDLEDYLDGMQD